MKDSTAEIRSFQTPPIAPPHPPTVVGMRGGDLDREPKIMPFELAGIADIKPQMDAGDFVQGLLIAGGASVVYGPSNVGKSFFVLDLAAHVATGRPWRDGAHQVEKGAVIYVALEGAFGYDNRIEAMRREGLVDDATPLFTVKTGVNLLQVTDPARLVETVKQAGELARANVKLVVLDTLSRAIAGGNENASEDMTAAIMAVDLVRQQTGAHVMLVHHCGKDEARGSRGHSSLRAAVDTEIELHRPEGGLVTTARVTKQRDLEGGQLFPFSLEPLNPGVNRWGGVVSSCVVVHEPESKAETRGKPGRKCTVTNAQLLGLLPAPSTGIWQERAGEEFGVSRTTFFDAKKRLSDSGQAMKTKEGGWIRGQSPEIRN